MQVIYKGLLYEARAIAPKVWYHGTKVDFNRFDYKYAHVENSVAQYGPGFYMTTDVNEALMYAGDAGFIKEIKILSRQKLKSNTAKPSYDLAQNAISLIPEEHLEYVLSNWGQDKKKAMRDLFYYMYTNQANLGDQLQSIWVDCYKNIEDVFCETIGSMIDGVVYQRPTTHLLVGYNSTNYKIVNTYNSSQVVDGMLVKEPVNEGFFSAIADVGLKAMGAGELPGQSYQTVRGPKKKDKKDKNVKKDS